MAVPLIALDRGEARPIRRVGRPSSLEAGVVPTLLVPGLLSTADVFAPQISALWRYGSVTVASTAGGATIAAMASSILKSAPPRFALAGISMGGYICFEIMRQAPDRVLRLALLDTSAKPDTPEQSARRRATVERARKMEFSDFAEELFTLALYHGHRGDARLQALNHAMAQAVTIDDFHRNTEAAIARADARPGLGCINVPTTVLVGDHDEVTPTSHAREIADAIPGARLEIVPRCGHASTIEQPAIVNRILEDWVSAAWTSQLDDAGPLGSPGRSSVTPLDR